MKQIRTVTLNPAFDLHYEMERFEAGKENYVQKIATDAGGKGINTSRALTVCGVENLAYVVLGEENGDAFERRLRAEGIRYEPLRVPGRIRENITLHPAGQKETRISLDTFALDEAVLDTLENRMLTDRPADSLVSFSGRIPKGVSKERILRFLQTLSDAGADLVVDSNSLTPDDLKTIRPWFIKPNEEEVRSFADGETSKDPASVAKIAERVVKSGVAREVMVSLGGDGAVWSDGERRLYLRVPKLAHPVSTIGAGDSTVAGYLAATAEGRKKEDALLLAVAYGTAACMTAGTNPPRREDVADVFGKTSCEEI